MDKELETYLLGTLDKKADWIDQLEKYAKENHVPIMEPLGMEFLMQLLRMKKPKKILEIGTAIGYSALRMLEAYPNTKIVTIERDEIRYQEAVKNIKSLSKEKHISVLLGDALEQSLQVEKDAPYDLLFIDAAKGQYQKFFEIYNKYLSEDAIIVSDNVLYKGYVVENKSTNDRQHKIAKKIHHYNQWLLNHPDYKTTIIPIGDGVALSVKQNERE